MLDDVVTFLLCVVLLSAFVAAVALVAVAGAALCWAVRTALRRRGADRRLEALRERHYAEVRARAQRPLVELEPVEFDGWPLLDGEQPEPPVVFPRRRAA
ncbi:hypothetical protein VSS74_25050 [Conexibacter stalactiti]|uniref:Uncharacterized protein n=1 Tax=Conexibacter stalactiti TaxID=1940611 RepID=A0ABU4HWP1_9ACTN|nr:hypothetical protein [Conexibacter stalactiti]MDW5597643.1 hypothetical protein [Conexibacter stalactiti]MEC5038285.1 hypothetical protein [Conexibacter stalactiti]